MLLWLANSEDPDQTAPEQSDVYPDLQYFLSENFGNHVISCQLPSNNRITCILYVHYSDDLFHNMRQVFTHRVASGQNNNFASTFLFPQFVSVFTLFLSLSLSLSLSAALW